MDSWVLKQLRALVLTDLKNYIPENYFESAPESLKYNSSFVASEYLSFELRWGKLAAELGKKLYFQPPITLTARQISASELLMHLGVLASAESALSVTEQLSNKAAASNIPDGNSRNVASQLKSSVVPTFKSNISGALEQYIHHLTYDEAKPYISLLEETKQGEFKLMNKIDSKIINNNINVSGSVNGPIQVGESNIHTEIQNIAQSAQKNVILGWLMYNIGKILVSLISAALIAWLGLKGP